VGSTHREMGRPSRKRKGLRQEREVVDHAAQRRYLSIKVQKELRKMAARREEGG